MITIPALSGVVLAGWEWVHLPLLLFWWVGYFAFQAGALWLKSRRRPRYLPPLRTYALIAAPFGLAVLLLRPQLALWAPLFAPLIAIAVWAAWPAASAASSMTPPPCSPPPSWSP
jgi:hypothetical protein